MRLTTYIAIFAIILSGSLFAQTQSKPVAKPVVKKAVTAKPKPKPAGMTNQDVIDLVKAEFSEDLIIEHINRATVKSFDLSTKGLVALKTAGVGERLIMVMFRGKEETAPAVENASTPSTTGRENIKSSDRMNVSLVPSPTKSVEGREAGIYQNVNGNLVMLEPTLFSGGKTGGLFTSAMTAGVMTAKLKAVVRSTRANHRIQTSTPVFHFFFEVSSSGLANTSNALMMGASSPNEFVLARMTQKRNERELIVAEAGAFRASSGVRSNDTIDIQIEKVGPGSYVVTPRYPLTPGEYCFFHAAGASAIAASGTGKLFDFGVDLGATSSR